MLSYGVNVEPRSIIISCSDGRTKELAVGEWSSLITELLYPSEPFSVVWNVDYFTKAIASIFPKDIEQHILNGGRTILPDKTRIFYEPNRMLAVTYAGQEVNFFGLSRYADSEPVSLEGLLNLAQEVINAFQIGFGVTPKRLSSPVSVYSEVLERISYPKACDLPDAALPLINSAHNCMTKEWREVFSLGHWNIGEASDVDITSSYPSLIARLPDLSNAKFIESDTYPEYYYWGLLQGDLTVTRDISPFQDEYELHRKGLIKDQTITTDGLWLLKHYGGDFQLKHGYFIQLPKPYRFPFEQTMMHLYEMREVPQTMICRIAKMISVGIYGLLAQSYLQPDGSTKLGEFYNSVYSKMVTDRCSLKLANFIYFRGLDNKIINLTVDGFLCEGNLSFIPTKKEFGKFRLNEPSAWMVASQLYSWGLDKRPLSMTYSDIIKMINQKPNSSTYNTLDLNLLEYSRKFPKHPRMGKDLLSNKYSSSPY